MEKAVLLSGWKYSWKETVKMIKVLVVDDQKLLRESLKNIIEHDDEINVAGCTENGYEALRMCDELLPDLVLMDTLTISLFVQYLYRIILE